MLLESFECGADLLIITHSCEFFLNFSDGSKHEIELLITFLIIFFLKENVQNLVLQFISDNENEKKIECFPSKKGEKK